MMPVGFFWFCPVYLSSRFERFCFLETDNDNIECFELTTVQVLRISNCASAMGSLHDSFGCMVRTRIIKQAPNFTLQVNSNSFILSLVMHEYLIFSSKNITFSLGEHVDNHFVTLKKLFFICNCK